MQSIKKDADKKSVIQLVISVLTAALTAISTTSCTGHGAVYMQSIIISIRWGLSVYILYRHLCSPTYDL